MILSRPPRVNSGKIEEALVLSAIWPSSIAAMQAAAAYNLEIEASGQIEHEGSKVLLLVHPDNAAARSSVQAVIARYRQKFDQESVLWETAQVCVAS